MSDNEFTTVIIISGSKSGLVKMLNAALRGVGAGFVLADTDGGQSILRKMSDNNVVFQLQDLLNEGDKPLPREGVPVDEEGTEFFEDYGLRLADIRQKGGKLTLVFHFWSGKDDMGEWDYDSDSTNCCPDTSARQPLSRVVGLRLNGRLLSGIRAEKSLIITMSPLGNPTSIRRPWRNWWISIRRDTFHSS